MTATVGLTCVWSHICTIFLNSKHIEKCKVYFEINTSHTYHNIYKCSKKNEDRTFANMTSKTKRKKNILQTFSKMYLKCELNFFKKKDQL